MWLMELTLDDLALCLNNPFAKELCPTCTCTQKLPSPETSHLFIDELRIYLL